ncbi:DUF262 domain-containing protein [Campylobacter cuniculorum]|uniref:DUF262 domain-containing protein n=1 Tax=Campylobacter cuniculorum TaxID=374106 RepID=UPI0023F48A31|nr:DUF262 domain-containing HNH endonuclease family protein [Campylobacter cuniculorum]
MTPKKQTIEEFFQGEKQYKIPVYQRAYSWEEKQWNTFLEDLEEATRSENCYFFGNISLEESENNTAEIIDGQQRITTIIIFIRALYNILEKKEFNENQIKKQEVLSKLKEIYLNPKAKLKTVEYDDGYFENYIIKNNDSYSSQTFSQDRIKDAKEFFNKKLESKSTEEILKLFESLKKAQILSIAFNNKKDSILMFELQNNRGKELTKLEKLKSYLSYQIYTYCEKETCEEKLRKITKIFEDIYRLLKDIKQNINFLDEDRILNYFNIAKFDFNYRENDDEKNYKKELKKAKEPKDKVIWIEDYMEELKLAFIDMKNFGQLKSDYKDYLLDLDVWEVYPFIIKAYEFFREDKKNLEEIFKALEIIAFRNKLAQTRAVLSSRLNGALKKFKEKKDVENLTNSLKEICKNQYWSDKKLFGADDEDENSLRYIYRENSKIALYILMRYENYLRKDDAKTRGYKVTKDSIKKMQIEHIAPRTEKGEKAKSGYETYNDHFREMYVDCIGNLLLIPQSQNSSLGNEPFKVKRESYKNSLSLLQQREISQFAKDKWDKKAIDKRYNKLMQFIKDTWSFKE